jgi:hypothetical protein
MKRILLLSILLALTACAPATIAAPSPTPSSIPTSTQTATPAPTATMTATQIPPIEIIHQSLETCPGFEILCTNPHAFGLEGQALADWRKLREQKDNEYETAWRDLLSQTAAEGKWQAEFYTFFSEEAPDISQWDTLDWRQRMNAVAAWLRVYGDGLTAVNIPTSWIREAASSRELLFVKYKEPGGLFTIGYSSATSIESSTSWYDQAPSVLSFGKLAKLQWGGRLSKLGMYAKDYVSPVNYPGKSFSDVGVAFVYIRDKQGTPHATFIMFPLAQQTLEKGGMFAHTPPSGGKMIISEGTSANKTEPVQLELLSRTGTEKISISPEISIRLWQMFKFARSEPNLFWVFADNSAGRPFVGGLDVDTSIGLIAPPGYVFPPHP